MAELTGVAARSLGVAAGAILMALAFLPKALALVVAIPSPVVAAYMTVIVAMLFVIGMKMVLQEGIDYRRGLVVGVAFWIGVGFQNGVVFPEYVAGFAGGSASERHDRAGGLTAILMTVFVESTEPRRSRFEGEMGVAVLPGIRKFLRATSRSANGWDTTMSDRLAAAAEEALLTLVRQDGAGGVDRRTASGARGQQARWRGDPRVRRTGPGGENLQDRMALLAEHASDEPDESEMSLRLLRHLAAWVRHQQYHDTDILTVRVEALPPAREKGPPEQNGEEHERRRHGVPVPGCAGPILLLASAGGRENSVTQVIPGSGGGRIGELFPEAASRTKRAFSLPTSTRSTCSTPRSSGFRPWRRNCWTRNRG